jgi:hypothetical protein
MSLQLLPSEFLYKGGIFYFFKIFIPDPESRGRKGTGSRIRIRNIACYLVVGPLSLTLRRPVERGWMNTVRQKVADFPHSSCTTQHYHLSHLTPPPFTRLDLVYGRNHHLGPFYLCDSFYMNPLSSQAS